MGPSVLFLVGKSVSTDSASSLPIRVKSMLQNAHGFFRAMQVNLAAPGFRPALINMNSNTEMAIGEAVLCLVVELQSLEDVDLPVQARIGINSLRALIGCLVTQWQWERDTRASQPCPSRACPAPEGVELVQLCGLRPGSSSSGVGGVR
jgi:hypothetical protein